MGVLVGYEQKQIYVEDGLWPLINVLASKLDIPIYKLVNDALKDKVDHHLSADERKTLKAILRSKDNGNKEARRTSRRRAHRSDR